MKTSVASPAARCARPFLRQVARPEGDSLESARRMLSLTVFGPADLASQRAAAFAVDCGRNSGLALIADLEGFDAMLAVAA